jgi:hypothetical protein
MVDCEATKWKRRRREEEGESPARPCTRDVVRL